MSAMRDTMAGQPAALERILADQRSVEEAARRIAMYAELLDRASRAVN